jgi:hypothetical protein
MTKTQPNTIALIVLAISLIIVVDALSCSPNGSTDLYWQLRTGHDILQTKSPPFIDTYSWTRHGSPWVVHEWLSCIILFLVAKAAPGFVGLLLLKNVILAATICIFYAFLVRASKYRLVPAFLLSLCAAYPLSVGFQARPQMFTYLFTTITTAIILSSRDAAAPRRRVWCLVPLFTLWANLHSGVYLGVFLIGAWAAGEIVDGYFGRQTEQSTRQRKQGLHLLAIAGACFLGSLVNPYGIRELYDLVATVQNQNAMDWVQEWNSPSLRSASGIDFATVAGLCVLGMIYSRNRVRTADYIVVAVLLHSALYSLRNLPIFSLAAVMTASPYFFAWVGKALPLSEDPMNRSVFGPNPRLLLALTAASGFMCIGVLAAIVNLMTNVDWLARYSEPLPQRIAAANVEISANPANAVSLIHAGLIPADWTMYNNYGMGGYLIWALPQHRVSIDGRADLYFGGVLENYLTLDEWPYNWSKALSRSPSFVLTSTEERQARLFMSSPDWALVYVDGPDLDAPYWNIGGCNAMIFVRRSALSKKELSNMRSKCKTISAPDFQSLYHWYPAVQ